MTDIVVGLGGSGHEWASAAMREKEVVALAEERPSRRKYGIGCDLLAGESRKACLRELGADSTEVTHAVVCSLVPKPFYHALRQKVTVIDHHLAHAYSTFCSSGFERAAVLVADNSGSILDGAKVGSTRIVQTVSMYQADADGIRPVAQVTGEHMLDAQTESQFYQPGATFNSLGHLYRSATLALGYTFHHPHANASFSEDGKTMGLAPYGDERFVDDVGELMELLPDGGIRIDAGRIPMIFDRCMRDRSFGDRAGLAYAVQHHTERALLHFANFLHARTGLDALCIAGGVGLNSVANGRLARETPFSRVHVVPAPSDDGISLGCAYYGLHRLVGRAMGDLPSLSNAYLGPNHGREVDGAIEASGLKAEVPSDLAQEIAQALAAGMVVGVSQGRAEFGPRALGNRSVLSSPFPSHRRDVLNFELKKREWFRPYGPVIREERSREYFDFPGAAPYMSFVAPVLKPDAIPAATHVDGTARLQTVRQADNPLLCSILDAFEAETGVAVVINTSFNPAGAPIVETPSDGIAAAQTMRLDMLVLDDRLIRLSAQAKALRRGG